MEVLEQQRSMRFCYITQIDENDMHRMHNGGLECSLYKKLACKHAHTGEPVSTLPVQMNI